MVEHATASRCRQNFSRMHAFTTTKTTALCWRPVLRALAAAFRLVLLVGAVLLCGSRTTAAPPSRCWAWVQQQELQQSSAWRNRNHRRRLQRRILTRLAGVGGGGGGNFLSVEECISLCNDHLADAGGGSRVAFLDGTWFHKGGRDGRREFEAGPRIPGSRYFDLCDVAARGDLFPSRNPLGLRAMTPPPELFGKFMDAFGIVAAARGGMGEGEGGRNSNNNSGTRVVIYGRNGCHFLPRVWFTFKQVMKHDHVHIMNGTLEEWIELGGPVETEPIKTSVYAKDLLEDDSPPRYKVEDPGIDKIVDLEEMLEAVADAAAERDDDGDPCRTVIIDSRGSSFRRKGAMPNAVHIPYKSFAAPTPGNNTVRWKSADEIRRVLVDAGVVVADAEGGAANQRTRVVCTCGSGVSACSVYLAMHECGLVGDGESDRSFSAFVYDGSWQEWGQVEGTPKVRFPS